MNNDILEETDTIEADITATTPVSAPLLSRQTRDIDDEYDFFKGVIQDVRLGNGRVTKIVNLYQLDYEASEGSLGQVKAVSIKQGEVSDDTCRKNPCQNGGSCHVTWNDYFCECPAGYKGSDCKETEWCHWFTCPQQSTCHSLRDGHECVTNVTLNGQDTLLSYTPTINDTITPDIKSIKLRFRTQTQGTLLQLHKPDGQNIILSVKEGRLEIVVRAARGNIIESFTFGHNLTDGAWHSAEIKPIEGSLLGIVDSENDEELLEDNSVFNNLHNYVKSSEIIIGSSRLDSEYSNYFDGCLSEFRIADILLPYFTEAELVNNTLASRFELRSGPGDNVIRGECELCHEELCLNGGVCADKAEQFDCSCQVVVDYYNTEF